MTDIRHRTATPFAIPIEYIRFLHHLDQNSFRCRFFFCSMSIWHWPRLDRFLWPPSNRKMQNVKSYFSSWKPFWKSSASTCQARTLNLAPSNINFTSSSLGDLKHSVIDEKLMIDISTKLMESDCPPKLQICAHNNQWFALNNSHLLVYRQLERIGLCDTVGRWNRHDWTRSFLIFFSTSVSLWHHSKWRHPTRYSANIDTEFNYRSSLQPMSAKLEGA